MSVSRWLAGFGVLALLAAFGVPAVAQGAGCPRGRVVDSSGAAIAGATVRAFSSEGASPQAEEVVADAAGIFTLRCKPGLAIDALEVRAPGYAGQTISPVSVSSAVTVVLRLSAVGQEIEVAATRATIGLGAHAETLETLTGSALVRYPSLTLDESLRQHAGFELFRRSSSWIANPTSQGISLRGLGSTAASRTLVLADDAPLNDPFGGWIHWNESAPEAIEAVTVATGGGSDLYGSSALGGVIDVVRRRARESFVSAAASGAGEDTSDAHGVLGLRQGPWSEMIAGQGFRTAGYVPVAPASRGAIDRPANVHFQNAGVDLDRLLGTEGRAFLRGNLLNEARNNGTVLQTNGTRLWRWLGGDDWSAGKKTNGRVRLFGSNEGYRQTFSSINAPRDQEMLTRRQGVRTAEFGAATDAEVHWDRVAAVFGADLRDLRATDREQPISGGRPSALQDTTARQRFVGGFGEVLGVHGPWSGAASLRVDNARNLDARTIVASPAGSPSFNRFADRGELVLSPRVGVVRSLRRRFDLHATGYRAFRTPTMNELYRTGQVGQEITQANPQLRAERATGAEGGGAWSSPNRLLNVHANYFWTAINRPVSAVLVSSTPTTITNQRQNLGQIVSQGLETAAHIGEGHAIQADIGYQYAHATVTKFSANPSLIGLWIPQVPRHSLTAQLRLSSTRWGTLVLAERVSGQAFDDSSNQFLLRRFSALDVYADRSLPRGFAVFVSVQNALNQRADVARTPVLTLGTPLLAQGGVRYAWPRPSGR